MSTEQITLYRPAEKGDRVLVTLYYKRRYGRVTSITLETFTGHVLHDGSKKPPTLMYHILGDDGLPIVIPARYVQKESLTQTVVVTLNPLDVKPCRYCGAYLPSGLQDTVHPHHSESCELYPDNAWQGYKLVKIEGGEE